MGIPRVDIRVENYNGRVNVLVIFEDEQYWRPNERKIFTHAGGFSSIDRVWYRKYTRPATYRESFLVIEELVRMYEDIEFCTIDWQAHNKQERKERKKTGKA